MELGGGSVYLGSVELPRELENGEEGKNSCKLLLSFFFLNFFLFNSPFQPSHLPLISICLLIISHNAVPTGFFFFHDSASFSKHACVQEVLDSGLPIILEKRFSLLGRHRLLEGINQLGRSCCVAISSPPPNTDPHRTLNELLALLDFRLAPKAN